MKFETRKFNLTAALVNFFSWLFIVFDGYLLGEDLNHGQFLNEANKLGYGLLIGFLIVLILKLAGVKNLRKVLTYVSITCWFVFLILQSTSPAPYLIPWITAYKIRMGLFLAHNFIFLWIFGMVNCSILTLTLQHRLENCALNRKSMAVEFMLAFAVISFISLCHYDFSVYGIEIILAVISVVYLILNKENVERDSTINYIPAKRNIIIGFFCFIVVTAMFYGAFTITTASFNYYSLDIVFSIFFAGAAVMVVIGYFINDRIKNDFPFYVYIAAAAVFSILTIFIMQASVEISDSTYITNPPVYYGPILGGFIFGLLVLAIDKAYVQFKFEKAEYSEFQHNVFRARRYFPAFGFSFMLFFAAVEGLDLKTYSDSMEEVFIISFWGILAIIVIIGLIYIISYFTNTMPVAKDQPTIYFESSESGENNKRNVGKQTSRGYILIEPRLLKSILLMVIIFISGFALFPNIGGNDIYDGGMVNLLGSQDDVVIAEVSPLIKVDHDRLIPRSLDPSAAQSNPMVERSMARNEFESIQISLSNWRLRELQIENITISNSSYGGYNTAFSGDPIQKTWKGEEWNWSRFTPHYVDEIQDGYPNILYEFYGNQTQIVKDNGTIMPRPEPSISIGQTRSLWFTVYAGEDLDAGNYSDEITIKTNKWDFSFTLLTTIWNFTLSTNHSFRTAIGNRRVYYLENRDSWTKNFMKHRISPYFPHNRRDLYEVAGEVVTFDFTQFEEDLENAINHGLDSFRVTYKPNDIDGPNAFSESWNNTALSFYQQLATFLKSHSLGDGRTWLDLALVYAMDEPSEDEYDVFNNWSNLIHSADPGWKLLLTEQVEEPIDGFVDIWCPHINSVNTANIGTQHASGSEFWYYTCCNLVNKPTVSFIDPAVDHKALFWCGWAFDFDGFLFWDAAAYVNQDVNDPYYLGYDNKGDAIMLLNDGNLEPVTTIVWETMRDGLEDVEYIEMLKEKDPTNEILTQISENWDDFVAYPRDYRDYTHYRTQIGELLDVL